MTSWLMDSWHLLAEGLPLLPAAFYSLHGCWAVRVPTVPAQSDDLGLSRAAMPFQNLANK